MRKTVMAKQSQLRDFGKRSGLKVYPVSMGAMRLPDEDIAIPLIRQGIDAGLMYIDTSRGYGDSELIQRGLTGGDVELLIKPFGANDLLAADLRGGEEPPTPAIREGIIGIVEGHAIGIFAELGHNCHHSLFRTVRILSLAHHAQRPCSLLR